MKLYQLLESLPGVFAVVDDILIAWEESTADAAAENNDRKLQSFLQRYKATGTKINKDKSVSHTRGHLLTTDGLRPDHQKVTAIPKCQSLPMALAVDTS